MLGDGDAAIATIAKARAAFPADVTLAIGEADLLRDYRGGAKAAHDLVQPILAADPDHFLAQKSQGKNWMAIGGLKEAGQIVTQALTASADNPDYGPDFLGLVQVQLELGEPGLAEQQLDTADRLA